MSESQLQPCIACKGEGQHYYSNGAIDGPCWKCDGAGTEPKLHAFVSDEGLSSICETCGEGLQSPQHRLRTGKITQPTGNAHTRCEGCGKPATHRYGTDYAPCCVSCRDRWERVDDLPEPVEGDKHGR